MDNYLRTLPSLPHMDDRAIHTSFRWGCTVLLFCLLISLCSDCHCYCCFLAYYLLLPHTLLSLWITIVFISLSRSFYFSVKLHEISTVIIALLSLTLLSYLSLPLSFSRSLSLSLSHTLSLTLSLTHSLSLSLTHTNTLSLALSHSFSPCLTHYFPSQECS
jgi:hypothetical protein